MAETQSDAKKELMEQHRRYLRVFETDDGQKVLDDLKTRGFHYRSSFSPEPGRTNFNEGRRSLVNHILHMTNINNFTPTKTEESHE
ncbi:MULTISPECIES: hypothetical protein [unclassified Maridesulfovibrio]|uniref:Bbp19 family protein n=1 Tax=unclassified Maridesulfovibrio TaxID=2794999 RepID=UPI0029CA18D6|nr:hypothetical protein [Maridesulfovibrio sp.]